MSRASLNARLAHDAEHSDDVEVVLIEIRHVLLPEPVLLSADNADLFDEESQLYGTWSRWSVFDPDNETPRKFSFAILDAILPSSDASEPHQASLAIADLDGKLTRLLRTVSGQAQAWIGYCMASDPDNMVDAWGPLQFTNSSMGKGEVRLDFSRRSFTEESFPPLRMGRLHFPGLHP